MEDLILIGKIRRAHGLKGELMVEPFTSDPKRFKKLKTVQLRDKRGDLVSYPVLGARITPDSVILKLETVTDRDQAEALKNQEVVIPESERAPLPPGKAYYDQIIGMDVVDDATGNVLGKVEDVLEMPAGEVFVLRLGESEHLLSNAGEEVKKIDVASNQLRVTLLEEY